MTTSRLAPLFSTGLRRTAFGGAVGFVVGLASGVLALYLSGADPAVVPSVRIVATLTAGATATAAFAVNFGYVYIEFLTGDYCYANVDPLWDRLVDGPLPPGTVDPGGADL